MDLEALATEQNDGYLLCQPADAGHPLYTA
jgi:hypothetical protein